MEGMIKLKKFIQRFDFILSGFENTINGAFVLVFTLLLFLNIVLRYIFHAPFNWAEEIIRYAFIWVTFFGASQCAKLGTHVGIDIFVQKMPHRLQCWVRGFSQFFSAACCAICFVSGLQIMQFVNSHHQLWSVLRWPTWILYLCLPLGCGLMTIRFVVAGVNYIIGNKDAEVAAGLVTDEEGNIDMTLL